MADPPALPPLRVRLVAPPVVRAGLAALLAGRDGRAGRLAVLADADPDAPAAPADVVVWAPPWHELDAAPERLARGGTAADAGHEEPPLTLGADGVRGPGLVVVADAPGAAWTAAMLRAGVRAVVPSAASPEELQTAVEAAAAGFVAIPAELAGDLLALVPAAAVAEQMSAAGVAVPDAAPLTPRERDVLALLAEGLANKQIAPRLGISEHTVKAHVAAIFAKLGAGTRAEAVVTAARRGLLML